MGGPILGSPSHSTDAGVSAAAVLSTASRSKPRPTIESTKSAGSGDEKRTRRCEPGCSISSVCACSSSRAICGDG
eukprot:762678-Prymnesium_polylepis.1